MLIVFIRLQLATSLGLSDEHTEHVVVYFSYVQLSPIVAMYTIKLYSVC